jgi:hypothetical protein
MEPERLEGRIYKSEKLRALLEDRYDKAVNIIGDYDNILIYTSVPYNTIYFDREAHVLKEGFTHICICHIRKLQREFNMKLTLKMFTGAFQTLSRFPAHIANTEILRIDNYIHRCTSPPAQEATMHSLQTHAYLALVSHGFGHRSEDFIALYEENLPESIINNFPPRHTHFLRIRHEQPWFIQRHNGFHTVGTCNPGNHPIEHIPERYGYVVRT